MCKHNYRNTPPDFSDTQQTLQDLGFRLKTARRIAGMTQQELAECCGVSQQCISYIERGIREPMSLTLKKAAEGLECSMDYLLSGTVTQADLLTLLKILFKNGYRTKCPFSGQDCRMRSEMI